MPESLRAATPSSRYPACAMLEYPSSRFKFRCGIAHRFPYKIVIAEMIISSFDHCSLTCGTAVKSTRIKSTNPAAFEPVAKNAAVGEGEPWYTSGPQICTG